MSYKVIDCNLQRKRTMRWSIITLIHGLKCLNYKLLVPRLQYWRCLKWHITLKQHKYGILQVINFFHPWQSCNLAILAGKSTIWPILIKWEKASRRHDKLVTFTANATFHTNHEAITMQRVKCNVSLSSKQKYERMDWKEEKDNVRVGNK